jgi:hypothetical protein
MGKVSSSSTSHLPVFRSITNVPNILSSLIAEGTGEFQDHVGNGFVPRQSIGLKLTGLVTENGEIFGLP